MPVSCATPDHAQSATLTVAYPLRDGQAWCSSSRRRCAGCRGQHRSTDKALNWGLCLELVVVVNCCSALAQPGHWARQGQSRLLTVSSHAQYGESYYVVISALNAAGLVGTAKSQDVSIERQSENLPPAKVAGIVLAAVLGTGAAVAALTMWITRRRCMPWL